MGKVLNTLANYFLFFIGLIQGIALLYFDCIVPKLTYGESYIVIYTFLLGGFIAGKINDAIDLLSEDK